MSVPDEGYSNLLHMSVPDEGYSNLLYTSVPDEGYSRGVMVILSKSPSYVHNRMGAIWLAISPQCGRSWVRAPVGSNKRVKCVFVASPLTIQL